jgi:hypothetical protein
MGEPYGLSPCLFCGAPSVHGHHPTGRLSPDGPYLDPGFVVPICRGCHGSEHAAWRDIGIDVVTDPVAARLLRLAWLIGRLVDLDRAEAITVDVLKGIHECLLRTVEALGAALAAGAKP